MQEKKILPRRKGVVLLSVLGCLFVFFAKTEKDLASSGNILWTAGYIGSTLLWTVVLGCLLGFLGTWVVHRLWNRAQTAEDTGKKQAAWYARLSAWLQRRSGVQIFFGSLLFLLLAWLPVYLAYYPGICAYDAPVQTGQIMEHYYFDHHPIVVCGAAFCVGLFVLSAVFSATHAEQGDRREMLSMPIQQLSRCMIYHGGVSVLAEDDNTMDAADKALINDFILDEAYRDYDPGIADPVKRHTNTYVARYRSGEFIRVYLHLLTQYPGDMINAALATNAGFLSPFDTTHADVNRVEGRAGLSYVQTRWEEDTLNDRGIYKDSKWPWLFEQLESWAENNSYLRTPVLKYLFVPGSYLWLYLALAAVLVIVDRKRFCLPLAIVAGYYGTMLFGPTVQMRYVYPVMLALPYVLALVTGRRKNG